MNFTIPGSAVTIVGSNQQTVTNDKGYFEFKITGITDTSRNVRMSFVGYQVSLYRLKPQVHYLYFTLIHHYHYQKV
jgi:hypothetical protein